MRFTAVGSLIFFMLISSACAHNPRGEKLRAEEVTIDNWKQFEAQLRHALPAGTCFAGIQSYLESLGFDDSEGEFSYGYDPYNNTLHAYVPNLDRWLLVFITNLRIKILLTQDEKCLTDLKVKLWHMGP